AGDWNAGAPAVALGVLVFHVLDAVDRRQPDDLCAKLQRAFDGLNAEAAARVVRASAAEPLQPRRRLFKVGRELARAEAVRLQDNGLVAAIQRLLGRFETRDGVLEE